MESTCCCPGDLTGGGAWEGKDEAIQPCTSKDMSIPKL